MNCDEARESMLEADLTDLEEEHTSPLSEHLQECEACRRLADLILETESSFASALDSLRPGRSFEETVVAAVSAPAGGARRRFRALPVLLPVAAAAAIFLLLVLPWQPEVGVPREPVVPGILAEIPQLSTPVEKTAMIIDAGDPDYQIIWLF